MKNFGTMIMVLCFVLAPLSAQMMGQRGERFQRPMERLERYKKIRMVETMKLDEDTGLKLVNRYNKHRDKMKEIESDRSGVIDKIEGQIRSNSSDQEIQKTINEYIEAEKKIVEARKKYLDELKDILTTKQIAEYMVFERDFMKDLRDVAKDIQKERQRK